ncbi:MAG TPA: tRNA (adenosine(37)-N6)-threonylcarbamoyltransferase complex ATPase subunit type 1 TsaE [Alphaproteobacteria bacterium]|nr:tRNA (adenosine(37)-N6)-threonylcarbamoyltransferase complex ATPase subunit type 1 TsaE [Alphaproteobacteria bacterium]
MPETLHLADDAATADLGRRLAAALRPGDLVLLSGGLGAGKSALARAMIRALMQDEALDVPSPSFSLVQPYAAPVGPVLHADLYRLAREQEIDELGLFETPEAIVIVEWPERAPSLAGRATLAVSLAIARGGGRDATIEVRG